MMFQNVVSPYNKDNIKEWDNMSPDMQILRIDLSGRKFFQ